MADLRPISEIVAPLKADARQNMQALAHANTIRLEGARIRGQMMAMPYLQSRSRAAELLLDPPDAIARMRLGYFLAGVRRFGLWRTNRLLDDTGLPRELIELRISELSYRQRTALADRLANAERRAA